jgi:hypothetical protein
MWWWRSLWSSWVRCEESPWRLLEDPEEEGFSFFFLSLLRWLDLLLVERTEPSLELLPLSSDLDFDLDFDFDLEGDLDEDLLRLDSCREERSLSFLEERAEWSEDCEWDECLPEDSWRVRRPMPYARAARPRVCRISDLSPDRREDGMVVSRC